MKKNLLTVMMLMMILIFSQLSYATPKVERPENIDVAFVLDRSVSMNGDPINTAANAIAQAIQLMQVDDEVGLACYSHEAETVFPITTIIDENTMADAINSMNSITIFGMTSIGLGLQEGQAVLGAVNSPDTPQAMLLMSDGKQNHVPFVGDILPTIPPTTDVYTIGFGPDSDEHVLNVIANATGAFYRYCDGGNIAEVTEEIMQEIRDRGIVAKFADSIVAPEEIFIYDFVVDDMSSDLMVNLFWEFSDTDLNLQVTDPNGNFVEVLENEVKLNEFDTQTYYTIANPIPGNWSAKVTSSALSADTEDLFLHVSIDSELKLEVNFDSDNYYANDTVGLVANLTNISEAIDNSSVTALVVTPDFEEFQVTLYDDGTHNDLEANDGVFAGAITEAQEGTYTVTYSATNSESSFTRVSSRSTYVRSANTEGEDTDINFAEALELSNYPNPFNPSTTISFNLVEASNVKIDIYSVNGQLINTVTNEFFGAGQNSVSWDGVDGEGRPVASGLYFYKMKAGRYTSTKKMILMK